MKKHLLSSLTLSLALCSQAFANLPSDLKWHTNLTDPIYGSSEAKKGGTLNLWTESYPPTFRTIGPNSNGAFRSHILSNFVPLAALHPNTLEYIPVIATKWAFDKDGQTVHYKINPKAKWSDGVSITADDFVFLQEFMGSDYTQAPWYKNYYTTEITDIKKVDDLTVSITFKIPLAPKDLLSKTTLYPYPKHYLQPQLKEGWVEDTNWDIVPNSGPYIMSSVKRGREVTFKRKKDWWGNDLRYSKNRFNVDNVKISVLKDSDVAWLSFLKGNLDIFDLNDATYWNNKSKASEFRDGYIAKYKAYNERPRLPWGMYLNSDKKPLDNLDVRLGFQHAINMDLAIEQAMRGDGARLPQFHHGYGDYENKTIKARDFDIRKAQDYFAKAGFKKRGSDGILVNGNGDRLRIELTYNGDQRTDMMVILREEAKKAGVDLVLNKVDFTTRYRTTQERNHQAYWGAWTFGVGEPPRYWEFFHSVNAKKQTNNSTMYSNKESDKLIEQYRSESDPKVRQKIAKKLQQQIHDSASFVPGFQVPFYRQAAWKWVHVPKVPATRISDSFFYPMGYTSGGIVWIDTDEKKQALKDKRQKKKFEPILIEDETFKSN